MNYEEIREELIIKYATYSILSSRAYDLVLKSTWNTPRYHKAYRLAEYFRGQERALSYCLDTINLRIKAQREGTL